ncbi:MAG TPA: LuxR C-terminal-related transcriptional regulator [Patescibacteria group bacterium]|nr:LuxR C-terminal-related transcriptional regulator [Patescibacteria group bacterium]
MARPTRRRGNLPAEATSFVGRRRELAELRKKLATVRLVTLVGPGGVGKTRLAIRIGTDLARAFPDGAWLVELADVRDPGLVGNAVLAALDLRDQAATEPRALLLSHLRERKLLLLVDNCEHLVEAAALLVADVLRSAPGVRVVATSRQPLSVTGEHVIPIPPLELPRAQGDETLDQLRLNESVELFTERAAAASGRFELTTSNRMAVVDVCRRLDGLPLAIELAAVRTRVLTVEQIDDRLADRFGLLTGGSRAALPRHQTLRTTIEWSHDLLRPEERALFRRLSAFAGRFTLDDAGSVCAFDDVPSATFLDVLSSLVDKSLVLKEDARGRACYRLHETMREFGALRLRETGEEEAVELRYVDHYVSRCRQSAEWARYRLVEWLDWMDLEIDNIRSVLRRCLVRADITRGADLAAALPHFWATRATGEGVRWLDELLATGGGDPEPLARARYLRGFLAVLLVDPTAAMPALERAAVADRAAGRLRPLAASLSMASIAANMAGDRASAGRLLDEAQAVTAGLDDVPAALALLQARSLHGFFGGDLEAATSASSEGARLSREVGDLYTLKVWLLNLGTAALIAGELAASKPLFAEALLIAHMLDDRVQLSYLLDALGCHAAGSGQARLAAHLLGAADTVRTGVGARVMPFLAPQLAQAEASAIAALGASRFDAAFLVGNRLDRDAAVRLALAGSGDTPVEALKGTHAGLLSKREDEVARLVADGLTNKEIGARLFISEHTVDSHVRSILNKLGFDSRARIAAWMGSSNQ